MPLYTPWHGHGVGRKFFHCNWQNLSTNKFAGSYFGCETGRASTKSAITQRAGHAELIGRLRLAALVRARRSNQRSLLCNARAHVFREGTRVARRARPRCKNNYTKMSTVHRTSTPGVLSPHECEISAFGQCTMSVAGGLWVLTLEPCAPGAVFSPVLLHSRLCIPGCANLARALVRWL